MPLYALLFKAELKDVTDLTLEYDHQFNLKVKCAGCNEETDKVFIARGEEHEIKGSRGTANLVLNCKGCKKQNTISFQPEKEEKAPVYTAEDSGTFVAMATLDLRGFEVLQWRLGHGWSCKGVGTETEFNDLDLSEEFFDYDEKVEKDVSITDIATKIEKAQESGPTTKKEKAAAAKAKKAKAKEAAETDDKGSTGDGDDEEEETADTGKKANAGAGSKGKAEKTEKKKAKK